MTKKSSGAPSVNTLSEEEIFDLYRREASSIPDPYIPLGSRQCMMSGLQRKFYLNLFCSPTYNKITN